MNQKKAMPVVELDADDFPLHCPNPKMPIWSTHPRVFLKVQPGQEVQCPYCSTVYRLKPGVILKGHH
ncbi:MAG TPA: zinc-finger domain-containing protein [Burkholderiaceae bacterium]|jgi:uncharacterized Zn-finger protein|nr:zinc-finger domain-containing protein [Burkholderiaceae bacterium]